MDNRKWLSGAKATAPTAPVSPSSGYPTGGNPLVNEPPTNPGPWWFHQMGEELRAVIVAAGLTPSQSTLNQLLTAMQSLFGQVLSTSGVPYGFKIGVLIAQFQSQAFSDVPAGSTGQAVTFTWTTVFPTACLAVIPYFEGSSGAPTNWSATVTARSTTGATVEVEEWANTVNPGTLGVLAIGY